MKKLKLLDTFSGIGGFSYAAEKLVGGFKTTQFIEIDPYCQKVLKKHWPNVPIHDDIKTFTAEPFQFDAVCGGFPCQDISTAGRGKGITEESRSGLFYELMRVVRMVRPKYIVLENVAAILNNGLDIVLGELSEAGYDAEWAVISASSLGACHRRSRWWLVAYPNSKQSSGTESEIQARRIFSSSSTRSKNVAYPKSQLSYGSKLESSFNKKSSTSKSRNSNISIAYPDSDGHQGRCTETRNKTTPGQDSQIIGPTNTSELERCNNDGKDKGKSKTDGNLSRSSDGRKTLSTTTRKICDLSQESNNDQRISRENKNQENNDRTLVSEGQSGVQLSEYRKLEGNKTTSDDNSIQRGDDNYRNKRVEKQKQFNSICKQSNVTNSHSDRLQGEVGSRTYRTTWRTQNIRRLNPNWRQYESKPVLCRGDDGLRGRMDRLKALGNSVVPQVAAIPLQRVKDIHEQLTSVDR